jgi:hypothetical protein
MNAVRSTKNQYRGINAHLNSTLQQPFEGWESFHAGHINDIARFMQRELVSRGYRVEIEKSVQIRRNDDIIGTPRADVLITDPQPKRGGGAAGGIWGQTATLEQVETLPITKIMRLPEEELYYPALAIYRAEMARQKDRTPITWIELLSPSNKPGRRHGGSYDDKRLALLWSDIFVVELDYLHETPPIAADDESAENGSALAPETEHPYRIIVIDPRPTLRKGRVYRKAFDVDSPIPRMPIPLAGDDFIVFDFDPPYQRTFEEMYYGSDVNYAQFPVNFSRYAAADQARIAARMLAVLEAAVAGADLETAPLPMPPISLAAALEQLAKLGVVPA